MRAGRNPCVIDVSTLFRLWHDESLRTEDVALQLQVSTGTLRKVASRYGLTHRVSPPSMELTDAPSQSEELLSQDSLALSPWVEARAKEVRERHFKDRVNESQSASRTRKWRTA